MTKYLKVSPRGFANEVTYFLVPDDKIAEAEAEYAHFEDDVTRGGYATWTTDHAAKIPGVAVDWDDRHWL